LGHVVTLLRPHMHFEYTFISLSVPLGRRNLLLNCSEALVKQLHVPYNLQFSFMCCQSFVAVLFEPRLCIGSGEQEYLIFYLIIYGNGSTRVRTKEASELCPSFSGSYLERGIILADWRHRPYSFVSTVVNWR
jgi:hypothetical protein